MAELDDETYENIQRLCAQGDESAEDGDYEHALKYYWRAWDLLPEPQSDWSAATWILGAIGDANFLSGDFKAGRDNLSTAMHCPEAIGNPFLHLRLGQCQFELGNLDRAADELTRALMGGGEQILQDDDPKYWEFLKTKLEPPPEGWNEDVKKNSPWWKFW